ncbi:MAG: hypothetical protein ACWGQW_21080 [bacterium]
MYSTVEKLTADDILWIHNATVEAFKEIKNIHGKAESWVDGEVFTYLRRMAREHPSASNAVRALFLGKKKNFIHRLDGRTTKQDMEILSEMYNGVRRRMLSTERDPVTGLQQALLEMQATARKAEEIANDSAKLREGLEGIRTLLEDKEPLVKEESNE